jgi:hypothetical protein
MESYRQVTFKVPFNLTSGGEYGKLPTGDFQSPVQFNFWWGVWKVTDR